MFRGYKQWDFSLGPVFGLAGTSTVLSAPMQCRFRVEKVMASDTGDVPGNGTRIAQFLVGQRIQRPSANGSTSSQFFGPGALGNGLRWDTCEPGQTISVTVNFVQSCTFDISVFGSALS
jgi:hypothetical protein